MTIENPIQGDNPDISVVIPTIPSRSHNEVVDCLRQQTGDIDYEVIIVNDDTLDICEARNLGIETASGNIISLTDDDCRPPEDWIEKIESYFHQDLVCLEGRVEGGLSYEGDRKYVGCNLSFDRTAALSIGKFDSEFGGWRDDTEFGWRMEEVGQCEYVDSVLMNHPPDSGSDYNPDLEERLRSRHPQKYESVLIPDTFLGRINDWMWKKGVFEAIQT